MILRLRYCPLPPRARVGLECLGWGRQRTPPHFPCVAAALSRHFGGDSHKSRESSLKRAREALRDRMHEVQEDTEKRLSGVRGRIQDETEKIKDYREEVRERIGDARAEATERAQEVKGRIDGARADAMERAEEGKKGLKQLWQRYGVVSIGTYFSIYFLTLGTLYAVVDQGFLTWSHLPADLGQDSATKVEAVLTAMPDWAELKARVVVDKIRSEPHFRSFMMAWLVTKLTEPLRLVVTVGITPRIARALGRAPPKEPRS